MEKVFDEPTKKVKKTPIKHILDVMPSGMREVYNDFHGDVEYLQQEWNYCRLQYDRASRQALAPGATFNARHEIRKISSYWLTRKHALEKTLSKETLKKVKND